ncbi:hypothetical protein PL8927_610002 [Planktothrix serta PCC 8927]|uniref:Uncharacterized protein n=1 Tax=Planktothrix serta PCC 8927 TaxID=671068 RepID=A0A7Z9E030_9CYAN|nr:hypothetical protein PL8927_610002 [Planktothrix serta PCC 8927]
MVKLGLTLITDPYRDLHNFILCLTGIDFKI